MSRAGSEDILNIVSRLIENEGVRVNLTTSGKAALISGLCTIAGGIMGGSVGVTVGGVAATLVNSYLTPNYAPLSEVIQSGLTEEDKQTLAQLLKNVMRGAPGAAVAGVLSNDRAKAAAIQAVVGFVQNKGLVRSAGSSPRCSPRGSPSCSPRDSPRCGSRCSRSGNRR